MWWLNMKNLKRNKHFLFVFSKSDLQYKMFFFFVLCCINPSSWLSYEVHAMISLLLECLWWKLHQGREIIATGTWKKKPRHLQSVKFSPDCQERFTALSVRLTWGHMREEKNKLQAPRSLAALYALMQRDDFWLHVTNWGQGNVLKWWLLSPNVWITCQWRIVNFVQICF